MTEKAAFELDEVFWFLERKSRTENRANIYIMTMMSRIPRQIVGFAVDKSVNACAVQKIIDDAPAVDCYYTDGSGVYLDVVFSGKFRRNPFNKNDTHNIESTNADLRHYIPGLARRNRCFYRSADTLRAVLSVYINAYNKFGEAKQRFRLQYPNKQYNFAIVDFL